MPLFDLEVLVHVTKDLGATGCDVTESAEEEGKTESLALHWGGKLGGRHLLVRLFTRLQVRLFMKKEKGRIGVGAKLAPQVYSQT